MEKTVEEVTRIIAARELGAEITDPRSTVELVQAADIKAGAYLRARRIKCSR